MPSKTSRSRRHGAAGAAGIGELGGLARSIARAVIEDLKRNICALGAIPAVIDAVVQVPGKYRGLIRCDVEGRGAVLLDCEELYGGKTVKLRITRDGLARVSYNGKVATVKVRLPKVEVPVPGVIRVRATLAGKHEALNEFTDHALAIHLLSASGALNDADEDERRLFEDLAEDLLAILPWVEINYNGSLGAWPGWRETRAAVHLKPVTDPETIARLIKYNDRIYTVTTFIKDGEVGAKTVIPFIGKDGSTTVCALAEVSLLYNTRKGTTEVAASVYVR